FVSNLCRSIAAASTLNSVRVARNSLSLLSAFSKMGSNSAWDGMSFSWACAGALASRIRKAKMPSLWRKRNVVLYDDTGFVSHHDAEQALESARDSLGVIRADITA